MAKERISNALQELKAAIKEKRPERLYIFHGEEDFLLNYYLQQLKKLLIDKKIPAHRRNQILVVADDSGVLAIPELEVGVLSCVAVLPKKNSPADVIRRQTTEWSLQLLLRP